MVPAAFTVGAIAHPVGDDHAQHPGAKGQAAQYLRKVQTEAVCALLHR
jgi:hypothetical protein